MFPAPLTFTPVGTVHCDFRYRFETARQGVFAENCGFIELFPGHNYEQALEDLGGFERIWVVFAFHLNDTWKPKVTPPVAPAHRRFGVFATRAPHRPNPIGISCVELEKVENLRHPYTRALWHAMPEHGFRVMPDPDDGKQVQCDNKNESGTDV